MMLTGIPEDPAELQKVVDAAAGFRALADCKMYGLLKGGPTINVARCDEILEAGIQRGILPSRPAHDLAIGLAIGINEEAAEASREKFRTAAMRAEERKQPR